MKQEQEIVFLKSELEKIKTGEEILQIRRDRIEADIRELEEAIIIQSPETLLQIQKDEFEEEHNFLETREDIADLEQSYQEG